jgi:transposase
MNLAADNAVSTPLIAEQSLPDDLATLKRMIGELVVFLRQSQRDNESLRHRIEQLLRRLYGPRAERFDPNQLLLFAESAGDAEAAATEPAEAAQPKRRCRPHGRRRLPADLLHQPCHHVLSEAERICPGCGQLRIDIGADQSAQLEYRPASLFVIDHFVHKYVCPGCSRSPGQAQSPAQPVSQEPDAMPVPPPEPNPAVPVVPTEANPSDRPAADGAAYPPPTDYGPPPPPPLSPAALVDPSQVVIAAAKPAMPIAKGLPGPGLLAHLIVSKYVDHLPLYRLERVYERQGVFLHRSTLCDWLAACAELLRPLYELMISAVLQSRALHTDDTTVKMQELVTHQLSTARFWAYLGDGAHPYNVFDFTVNRKRDGPQQFLATYQGYLHADAFSGYDGLYLPDPQTSQARIVEVACNAHARRKFYEARSSAVLESHRALAYYGQLYELERAAQRLDFSDTQKLQMRQDLEVPMLEEFHQWLEEQRATALPKSPLAEAVGYALHNWMALIRYTEAGFLAIDNNVAEREMKRIAIGRKNWLFVGSPQGGKTAAVLMSFTSTCHRLRVEPWAYLQDVLRRLPTQPTGQLGDLLPDHWQAAQKGAPAISPPGASAEGAAPSDESTS